MPQDPIDTGRYSVIAKPCDMEELQKRLQACEEHIRTLRAQLRYQHGSSDDLRREITSERAERKVLLEAIASTAATRGRAKARIAQFGLLAATVVVSVGFLTHISVEAIALSLAAIAALVVKVQDGAADKAVAKRIEKETSPPPALKESNDD